MSEDVPFRPIKITDLDIEEAAVYWYGDYDTVFVREKEKGGHVHLCMFNAAEAAQVVSALQEFLAAGRVK